MKRLTLALVAILLISTAYALTITGPTWSPSTAYKNNTINCSWSFSGDTLGQNITLLRNSAYFNSTFENSSSVNLSSSILVPSTNLTKGDQWSCRVTTYNETSSLMQSVSITILNSPPTTDGLPAGIFNSSALDIGYLVQIREDTTLNIDVNATDADSDTLTYLSGEEFCTRTSSSAGTYTCSPTQSHITSNLPTQINITFTVTDGQNVGGRTVTFNITPVNDAPATTLTAQTTSVNQSLNYTFTVTDEESSFPLTFVLTAPSEISNKVSVTKLNANGNQVSFYYDQTNPDFNDIGLWNITINITDNSTMANGTNDSVTVAFNFTLNITPVGRTPYFTNITPSGLYNIAQGQFFQINISANDPDANSTLNFSDDTTKFNVVTTKADTNTSDARAQINYTPSNDDVGMFNVTITLRDATTLTNTTILQFNISNTNDAPTVHQISTSSSNTQNNTNISNLTS